MKYVKAIGWALLLSLGAYVFVVHNEHVVGVDRHTSGTLTLVTFMVGWAILSACSFVYFNEKRKKSLNK